MKVSRVFYLPPVLTFLVFLWAALVVLSSFWSDWNRVEKRGAEVSKPLHWDGGVSIDSISLIGALGGARSEPVAVEVSALSRYRLCGYAATAGAAGAALLSVDGGTPKIFRVGREVDGIGYLVAIEGRGATFLMSSNGGKAESRLALVKCS